MVWLSWDCAMLEFRLSDPSDPEADPPAFVQEPVPAGAQPEVVIRLDVPEERARGLSQVTVQLLLAGVPLGETGVDIALTPIEVSLWGPGTRWGVTDDAGKAVVWVRSGTYKASCGPTIGPASPVTVTVPDGTSGTIVTLEFPSGSR